MPPPTPLSKLSKREQIIVLKASKLYEGHTFAPWKEDPGAQEFEGPLFTDSYVYQLSQFQSDILSGWERPSATPSEWQASLHQELDLVQDVTNDCSIVASFCVASARAARVRSNKGAHSHAGNIFSTILHPFGSPSQNGKYHVKLYFNGHERRVTVDSQLPVSRDDQYLHVTSRDQPGTAIWPALIEKAYLKVMGGYDFPGSDSATDLWALAGWVPEQISLASNMIGPADLWRRVATTFEFGDVMITLGTPKLSILEEKTYGLAGGHDYAVIDLKEENGVRKFLIKNPWSHASDHLRSSGGGLEAITEEDEEQELLNPVQAQANLQGTRWWDLHDVFRLFETAYLSWNPDIFKHRLDVHFEWDLSQRSAPATFTENPQYIFASKTDCTVWLVLSRHIDPSKRAGDKFNNDSGYVSLYAFQCAQRMMLNDGAKSKTSYVNSQNVLLRMDIRANEPHVVVVSEQMIPVSNATFSLSAFSTKPLQYLESAPHQYDKADSSEGSWAVASAGGNANSQYFHLNPQFKLDVTKAGDVAMLLSTSKKEVAVNVRLVWANGKRIRPGLAPREVYCSSGEYRRGSALAEAKDVPPGTYTIVCSAFDKGQRAPFELRIFSAVGGCTLGPAVSEDAGMFKFSLKPAVFKQGNDRVLCPLQVGQTSKILVKAFARSSSKTPNSPFSLALEYGQGPEKKVLATSGQPESHAKTASLSETQLHAKWSIPPTPGIWLVVERVGGAIVKAEETISVQVLCTAQDFVAGPWGQETDETIEELNRKTERMKMAGSG